MIVLSLNDVKELFDTLAEEFKSDARDPDSPADRVVLNTIAHRLSSIDWDFIAKKAKEA